MSSFFLLSFLWCPREGEGRRVEIWVAIFCCFSGGGGKEAGLGQTGKFSTSNLEMQRYVDALVRSIACACDFHVSILARELAQTDDKHHVRRLKLVSVGRPDGHAHYVAFSLLFRSINSNIFLPLFFLFSFIFLFPSILLIAQII